MVSQLSLERGQLIVLIRRSPQETIIPNGSTVIREGDVLVINRDTTLA